MQTNLLTRWLIGLVFTLVIPFTLFAGTSFPEEKLEGDDVLVNAYPNPSTSVVNVQIADKEFQMLTLSLEDLKGKALLVDRITQPGVHTINMRLLSSGSYVLHIQSKDGTVDERMPIQKL